MLLLLGPFVDVEHPLVAAGLVDRPLEALCREEVVGRLTAWQASGACPPGTCAVAVMPSTRDVTALPVFPQPPLGHGSVGPASKVSPAAHGLGWAAASRGCGWGGGGSVSGVPNRTRWSQRGGDGVE